MNRRVEVSAPLPNAASTDGAVVLESLAGELGLDELRASWETLIDSRPGSVFDTPLWIVNYWRYQVEQRGRLTFLVARSAAGEVVALVPLVRLAHLGLAPLQRAVHATGEYPSDWPCRPEYAPAFAAAVCDELLGRRGARTQLGLTVVPESSPVLQAMEHECERRRLPFQLRRARRIPFVDTPVGAEASVPLRGKYRRELRRRRRALEQSGPLTIETCVDPAALPAAFADLVRVEGENWKGEQGTAIGSKTRTRRFWWELAREAAELGALRLDLLRLGEQVISGQLGLVWKRRYYCLKIGYDARWSKFGPGSLLTEHVIHRCVADSGIDVYDFAGAEQPYMWNWTDRSYQTWTLTAGARRPRRPG